MGVVIHDVEQNTDEWFSLRAGVPTASEFKKVLSGTGKKSAQRITYAAQLAAELCVGGELERWEGNQWTERGHELEAESLVSYELERDSDVKSVGFVLRDKRYGASPDGLVSNDGLLEIKNLSPAQHVLVLDRWRRNGTVPPDYIPQCQGQLFVCDRQWVDLYFHHTRLPTLIARIERDQEYIDALQEQLDACIAMRDDFMLALT